MLLKCEEYEGGSHKNRERKLGLDEKSDWLRGLLIHQGFLDHYQSFYCLVSCLALHGVIFLPSFLPIGSFDALKA